MLHWQRSWIIIQIDFHRKVDLYLFLGMCYAAFIFVTEWLWPGTWPMNVWQPETWLHTIWRGK